MTGYGQGAAEAPGLRVTVELRSVNNRFADLKLRLPESLASLEQELRRKVLATVKRGRVDVDLRLERTGDADAPLVLNRRVVEAALGAWKTLRDDYGIQGVFDLQSMMRVPGVFETEASHDRLDEPGRLAVDGALDLALRSLDEDRRREGAVLRSDLASRVSRMREVTATIRSLATALPQALQQKITERVQQLAAQLTLDPARIAQEAAFLADRADVTEELVRLDGHLVHAEAILADPEGAPVGKRLEFLLQEINRETNTITSKSADLEISRHALELKAECERIREQIQNVE